ncbi:glycosyltransferase family 9 protein [Flexivirga sp.]|uniref:glycosyltransferase family 9 protein n=1 Tax=Flexivirga sp. TaxID=1962927 RepID=UPI003F806129
MTRVLAVRMDGIGDVLLTGPAVRAIAAGAEQVDYLSSTAGAAAAALLPGVTDTLAYDAPWVGAPCHSTFAGELAVLVGRLRETYDEAIIFTSFHQSPLPAAMVCRLAGIPRIAGTSDAGPGSLLDVRHRRMCAPGGPETDDDGGDRGGHEVHAALRLAEAAGYPLPAHDDARLRLTPGPVDGSGLPEHYVVVHPGASVPARQIGPALTRDAVQALVAGGRHVVLTGDDRDRELISGLAAQTAADAVTDLLGRTDLQRLRQVIAAADAVVAGNTGAAHLAASVGTPVVSVFAPVVPAARWRPWGVPHVLLGDQGAACAASRARVCPVPGHPCMRGVTGAGVVAAVDELTGATVREVSCAS